jgi:hypothetical protein
MPDNNKRKRTYPDKTFEDAARKCNIVVKVLWEMPGPSNTAVAWMVAYSINGRVAIVQTYFGDCGWDVFTQATTTVEALNRCGTTVMDDLIADAAVH